MRLIPPFTLESSHLKLVARHTPWDTECFGFPVAQIDILNCRKSINSSGAMQPFLHWLNVHSIRLVSCRLPYDCLVEAMLLENFGFRFVETVLHPYLELRNNEFQNEGGITIETAVPADIAALETIATTAFKHGRIHADLRLGPALGNLRYGRWVKNSLSHPSQRLLKVINHEGRIVGLFITEAYSDQSVYWHLTAISAECSGLGYGWRAWRAMLAHHTHENMCSVRTTITAGNVPVLNLYSKLGFRFLPPEITFHWLRESSE